MAWLAVDGKNNTEWIYDYKPERASYFWFDIGNFIQLPKGTIKKLIGRELTWDDEPVKI